MEQEKIERINALARKAREEGLTETEREEQRTLRREYIDTFKQGLSAQLDHTVVVDENGNRRHIRRKD